MCEKVRQAVVALLDVLKDQDCLHHVWEDIEFLPCGEHGEPAILQTCKYCGEEREKSAAVLVGIVESIVKRGKITWKRK